MSETVVTRPTIAQVVTTVNPATVVPAAIDTAVVVAALPPPVINVTEQLKPVIIVGGGGVGGGDPQNVFIQEDAPVTGLDTYLWFELNPDTTPKTLWVNS